ncbi:MAG: hypothetical protein Fues2KO_47260 [Fuerstiella sp.]
MAKLIQIAGPVSASAATIELFAEGTDTLVDSQSATAGANGPELYTASFAGLAAGRYRAVLLHGSNRAVVDHVTVSAADDTYPVDSLQSIEATLQAGLIEYFEALTRAKGSLSVLRVLELIQAAVMGLSNEPVAGQERYQFADNTDAFTVTFDANNFRTARTLH